MKKHRIFRWILTSFLLLFFTCGALGLWLWHAVSSVPQFYQELAITAEARKAAEKNSDSMERKVRSLRYRLRKEKMWILEFNQDEFNHWLAIAIGEKRPGVIPHRLKDPRGLILEDRILAGVTVNLPEFQGVISVEVFPSITVPNTVDVELKNVSAGTVKLSGKLFQSLIERFAQDAALPIEVLNQDGRMILRCHLREGDLVVDDQTIEVQHLAIAGKSILITGMVR